MNTISQAQGAATRQCAYCGNFVSGHRTQCPNCRETLPKLYVPRSSNSVSRSEIRRGLLYMLLAAVIHYFAGGYSAMDLPFPINPLVTVYLSPLLFLGGLGLTVYGLYLHGTT